MTPRPPFILIPWQQDFLQGLTDLALEETRGNISRAVFIFPHNRPKRYLSLLLRQHPSVERPLIMPGMHTVSSLFTACAGRILSRPAWNAGLLDRVGLLLSCVRAESKDRDLPFLTEARGFFPWGVRLAALFEECFSQRRQPVDFLHVEDQVSPFASLLLERLGGIFARYAAALREREWTSPGFDASLTAEHLHSDRPLPGDVFGGLLPDPAAHPIYIAGFHRLTGTETILFRHLWEQYGARVVLHGDAKLSSSPDEAHWSCRALADWAGAWQSKILLREADATRGSAPERRIRYFSGFDLHSQLAVLREELAEPKHPQGNAAPEDAEEYDNLTADRQADTLVALPDSGLLMPVLHHLPRTDINISMGYPLARSPVFRLIDTLARLQEGRKNSGYYWRDLVDLIRHPYLKMLSPPDLDSANGSRPPNAAVHDLRRELHRLEAALRGHGRKYADPRELIRNMYAALPAPETAPGAADGLLEALLTTCLTGFENPERPRDLAEALERLCAFLLTHGRHLWKRFPIDAECLYRLRQSLIPELGRSELANERFTPDTLFTLLRSLMEAERVPFEAVPLVGLQVMGMLETRLLSFRRVCIVDAGENVLPGSPAGDPLLPEALRREIGLPPLQNREQAAAYTFFRLIAGAEDVVLLWQEGGDESGMQEQKKKKSRFIEELLWEEEKRLGRLLAPQGQDGPLTVLESRVAPVPLQRRGIPVTPPIRDLITDLLKKPVSASLLDSYLCCPARFFHERLIRLAPADEVNEGDDPLAVGTLFHVTLQQAYAPYLGMPLPGGETLSGRMEEELLSCLFASPSFAALTRSLPADSAAMLAESGKKRLADYLLHQPPTTVLALESSLTATFSKDGGRWTLTGTADRIDVRSGPDNQQYIVIIDYKTGTLPVFRSSLWEDEALWQRLAAWRPSEQAPDGHCSLLSAVADRLESIQLPLYLLLHDLTGAQLPHGRPDLPALDAAWVHLAHTGEEVPLFPQNFSREQRREMMHSRIPALVSFLLRHISESATLEPRPGKHCDWCFCAKLCNVSPALS